MPKIISGEKYQKKYDEENLQKALREVYNGLPLREVARRFGIPRATLQFRRSQKFVKTSFGPNPILSYDEEKILVKWISENHKRGFPCRKENIQESVKEFLDKNPRENPFVNNRPGEAWYKAFLRRNPEITIRTAEAVTAASANVSENDIRRWFTQIEEFLQEKNLMDVFQDPDRIMNADETCFFLCPKNTKVLAPKGARNVYEMEHASSKTTLTVMFTFRASGKVTPPMIIYPYKRLPMNVAKSIPGEWGIGLSDTGWMKAEIMCDYIENVLYPHLKNSNTTFPVILFLDGHSTHLTYKLSCLCKRLEIVLICLYPNSTRLLQPADVAAFKPIKNGWKKAVIEWRRDHPLESLTKEHFAPVLKLAIDRCAKSQTIKNGFRATGLYPWDVNSIDFFKCLGGQNKPANTNKETESEKLATRYISQEEFVRIVGNNIIDEFKTYDETIPENEQPILFQLWKKFKPLSLPESSVLVNEEIAVNSKLKDTEVCIEEKSDNVEFDINNMPIILFENEQPVLLQTFDTEQVGMVENIELSNAPNNVLYEDIPKLSLEVEESKTVSEDVEISHPLPLEKTLWFAPTPKRKGTKNTEKTSFAITSTHWLKKKAEEDECKRKKNEEKEERKKQRIEKQAEKKAAKCQKQTTNRRNIKKTSKSKGTASNIEPKCDKRRRATQNSVVTQNDRKQMSLQEMPIQTQSSLRQQVTGTPK
ncbi:uncharacterized protein LOC115890944, partial [Sitophilus oryzae]|uniref:Uncharacterized protein LOC115890944 n=1 Tax=Sitophilus oryzae TaxID=7048 RepID=A0A6J2YST6_SITOR